MRSRPERAKKICVWEPFLKALKLDGRHREHPKTMWIWKGEEVRKISISIHKPYLLKWSTKGERGAGVKNVQKLSTLFMDEPVSLIEFVSISRPQHELEIFSTVI